MTAKRLAWLIGLAALIRYGDSVIVFRL